MKFILFVFITLSIISCKKDTVSDPVPSETSLYFPPLSGDTWQSVSPESLSWNTSALAELENYLSIKNTKAFIILKNGKIVQEKYFGSFTADSIWYWASAGKTMTAMLVGIAAQQGILNIDAKTSDYLGTGWTNLPVNKENMIKVKHQLTMTTGLDDGTGNVDCTLPACLQYKSDAGTRWAYHNAPYTLLDQVIKNASGMTYNAYFQKSIRDKIGMNGIWIKSSDSNNVFYSTPRSMARFGLLLLNKGKWDNNIILEDNGFFDAQINTSQNYNLSYGRLTWLNGKINYMLPGTQLVFNGQLIPNGPSDLYAALGKNDQKIYVVPSQKLVIIRMGNSAGNTQATLSSFDNELWGKIKNVIN